MSGSSRNFINFLEPIKQDYTFIWASRKLDPQLAYYQGIPRPTPVSHKQNVLNSARIQELLDKVSLFFTIKYFILN